MTDENGGPPPCNCTGGPIHSDTCPQRTHRTQADIRSGLGLGDEPWDVVRDLAFADKQPDGGKVLPLPEPGGLYAAANLDPRLSRMVPEGHTEAELDEAREALAAMPGGVGVVHLPSGGIAATMCPECNTLGGHAIDCATGLATALADNLDDRCMSEALAAMSKLRQQPGATRLPARTVLRAELARIAVDIKLMERDVANLKDTWHGALRVLAEVLADPRLYSDAATAADEMLRTEHPGTIPDHQSAGGGHYGPCALNPGTFCADATCRTGIIPD